MTTFARKMKTSKFVLILTAALLGLGYYIFHDNSDLRNSAIERSVGAVSAPTTVATSESLGESDHSYQANKTRSETKTSSDNTTKQEKIPDENIESISRAINIARTTTDHRRLWRALKSITHCRQFLLSMRGEAAPHGSSREQADAISHLYDYCKTDELNAFSQIEYDSLVAKAAQFGNAPARNAIDNINYRDQLEARFQAACEVIKISANDPDVLPTVGAMLTRQEQTNFGYPVNSAVLRRTQAAFELARCRLGADCSKSSWLHQIACASDGLCFQGSTEEYIEKTVSADELVIIRALADEINKRIAQGSCDFR